MSVEAWLISVLHSAVVVEDVALHIVLFRRPGAALASRGRARQRMVDLAFILVECNEIKYFIEHCRVSANKMDFMLFIYTSRMTRYINFATKTTNTYPLQPLLACIPLQ